MRDAIEVVNTSEYPKFLSAFLPAFGAVLDAVPAQTEDNVEHKVRKRVLEMLNKLPHNEHLRPHDKTVLAMATKALRAENEENALVCLRVIFDLHRNFRPSLEFEVEPFLEFVRSVYENVEETVTRVFGEPAAAETAKEKKKGEKDAEASREAQQDLEDVWRQATSEAAVKAIANTRRLQPASIALPGPF